MIDKESQESVTWDFFASRWICGLLDGIRR